ncbi:hypothetical protein LMG29542_07615 [Paraburkholderia humisilvae]|uniref:Uncharacterized protein n=1 Tax=Paraburkholderia humisilvae TaxID=627669 RepID=A0A6J5F6M5_9BURK|nr:hypothetical protein LMG29542_07615 [Paraburkholderia humisilvae]
MDGIRLGNMPRSFTVTPETAAADSVISLVNQLTIDTLGLFYLS